MQSGITKGELVEFQTPDGFLLHGFLIGRRTRMCIICLHGMTSNFYSASKRNAEIAKKLDREGISVFAMNTRGHDLVSSLSYKKPGRWGKLVGTDYERFEDCLYDISGAMKALGEIGFRKFVLLGSSTGCQKIVYYQWKKSDRRVVGLILLSPGDDYNINRKRLGQKFDSVVSHCKSLVKTGHGLETDKTIPLGFGAKRFLSFADPANAEARLFNYDGDMREFSKIKIPICAVFGSEDESIVKSAEEYFRILKERTNSRDFVHATVSGAGHSFRGYEGKVSDIIADFAFRL